MRYGLQIWVKTRTQLLKKLKSFKKTVRIMCFKSKLEPAKPLYRDSKILKIRGLLTLINCQFVQAHMAGNLPQNFSEIRNETSAQL